MQYSQLLDNIPVHHTTSKVSGATQACYNEIPCLLQHPRNSIIPFSIL
jgi:hypothetical protein